MSDAMKNLRDKMMGKNGGVSKVGEDPAKPNPMLLGLMKSFGISPDSITEFAEKMKGAIESRLSSIDESLQAIRASQMTLEMKLSEIESNQRVILDRLKDPNEEQFAEMAEHPLEAPICADVEQIINRY